MIVKNLGNNPKFGYKYRSGDCNTFDRDLKALGNNYFWAPNYIDLNDPCETTVLTDEFKTHTNLLFKSMGTKKDAIKFFLKTFDDFISRRDKIGIYSLSTSFKDELLWAHYANSHNGFCIKYNLEKLVSKNIYHELHILPVEYKSAPPSISIKDASNGFSNVLQKLSGTKSIRWEYEDEIRIITDVIGENDYSYDSVAAIYFGLRMPDENKIKIMECLRGRGIKYYQIYLKNKSYEFREERVKDIFKDSPPYLFRSLMHDHVQSFEIDEQKYDRFYKKGNLEIKLNKEISKEQLNELAKDLKQKLFRKADRVFMFYILPSMNREQGVWATTHFEFDKLLI